MLIFDIRFWIGGLILIASVLFILRRIYRKDGMYLLIAGIFGIYMLNVIRYTFFPFPVDPQLLTLMRMAGSEPGMVRFNWIPFHSQFYDSILDDKSNYLNILMTVPYGLMVPFLIPVRENRARMVWLGLGIGLVIETLQGILNLLLGYTYRTVDINDIIFNFTGAMLGWGLLNLLLRTSLGQKKLAIWLPGVLKSK